MNEAKNSSPSIRVFSINVGQNHGILDEITTARIHSRELLNKLVTAKDFRNAWRERLHSQAKKVAISATYMFFLFDNYAEL
ncbi:hypothetical protein AMS62_27020 [Bacillus sp. FJAT-18019]|nr:hypothetical protein AMS62_27020 [Bacillus sp. FJAT-18019]